jgi:hypothetical protein
VQHTPFRRFQSGLLNESQVLARSDPLNHSASTSTEVQLLNGEIVHLRQRLQMEVLANQELEEVMNHCIFALYLANVPCLCPAELYP